MPTYEYECTRCGLVTSEFKPMSAPRRQRCPACRSKVRQLITGGLGIVFKGEGFYVNDSRAASRAKGKAAGGEGAGVPASDQQAAKPAEKPAEKPAGGDSSPARSGTGTVREGGSKAKDGK